MTFDTLYDGTNEKTLAAWGFGQNTCSQEDRTRDVSTWAGTLVNASVSDAPVFGFEQLVIIRSGRTSSTGAANSFSGGATMFVGYRVGNPLKASSGGQGATYKFENAWYLLKNANYLQNYSASVNAFVPVSDIILFTGYVSGIYSYLTVSQQITDILNQFLSDFAAQFPAKPAPFQVGSMASNLSILLPPYSCRPMMCADAILKCLESFVRTNVYFDYTTTPPTLNIFQVDSATPVTLALFDGTNHKSLNIVKREDLKARGVAVTYRITSTVNGQKKVDYAFDYWGAVMEAVFNATSGSNAVKSAAAVAVSGMSQYIAAYIASSSGTQQGKYADAIAAVNSAVAGGTCDPFSGLRVVCELIDLSGSTYTQSTAHLDCEPVAALFGGVSPYGALTGDQTANLAIHATRRNWWASPRGGRASELSDSRVRFQQGVVANVDGIPTPNGSPPPLPVYIPDATFSDGAMNGASIHSAGSGYHVADILIISGGTLLPGGQPATLVVQGVSSSGAVTEFTLGYGGDYSSNPTTTNCATTVQPEGGTGATFDLSFLSLTDLLALYPNHIVRGSHHGWMTLPDGTPVKSIKTRIKSKMQYSVYDVAAIYPLGTDTTPSTQSFEFTTNGVRSEFGNWKDHHADLELTNGVSGDYSTVKSTGSAGESYVIGYGGIARYLFNALQVSQFEGNAVKVETSFTNGITLANSLNLSNGKSEWSSMAAQICSIQRDYGTHQTTVQLGAEKHLSAQQLSSFLNMWRYRREWVNPAVRSDNSQTSGQVDMMITGGGGASSRGVESKAQKTIDYAKNSDGSPNPAATTPVLGAIDSNPVAVTDILAATTPTPVTPASGDDTAIGIKTVRPQERCVVGSDGTVAYEIQLVGDPYTKP
jgi:hypothetical protein